MCIRSGYRPQRTALEPASLQMRKSRPVFQQVQPVDSDAASTKARHLISKRQAFDIAHETCARTPVIQTGIGRIRQPVWTCISVHDRRKYRWHAAMVPLSDVTLRSLYRHGTDQLVSRPAIRLASAKMNCARDMRPKDRAIILGRRSRLSAPSRYASEPVRACLGVRPHQYAATPAFVPAHGMNRKAHPANSRHLYGIRPVFRSDVWPRFYGCHPFRMTAHQGYAEG